MTDGNRCKGAFQRPAIGHFIRDGTLLEVTTELGQIVSEMMPHHPRSCICSPSFIRSSTAVSSCRLILWC